MNEIFEDDYIDFTEEIQEKVFICQSCVWFDGINWCLKSEDHNFPEEGVYNVTMCVDYEKIN